MRAIYGSLAVLAVLGFSGGEAKAFVVSQTGPVITAKCSDGKPTVGCSWCAKSAKGNCYVVTKCENGKCTVKTVPPEATKGTTKGRGTAAAPIKTTTTGDKAPVTTGDNPGRKVPVDVVNKSGGSSKKH